MTKDPSSRGILQSPGPRRALKDGSSPGFELGCPLGSLVCHFQGSSRSHPSPSLCCRPHGRAKRPTQGLGVEPSPAPGGALHCGLRLPRPGRAYPPRPPVVASPAGASRCPPAPASPAPPAQGRKAGGSNLGGPSRISHPTGTSLLHISNCFLSHFLARGGVSRAPPGTGPAPGPRARPPPPRPSGLLRAPGVGPAHLPSVLWVPYVFSRFLWVPAGSPQFSGKRNHSESRR